MVIFNINLSLILLTFIFCRGRTCALGVRTEVSTSPLWIGTGTMCQTSCVPNATLRLQAGSKGSVGKGTWCSKSVL